MTTGAIPGLSIPGAGGSSGAPGGGGEGADAASGSAEDRAKARSAEQGSRMAGGMVSDMTNSTKGLSDSGLQTLSESARVNQGTSTNASDIVNADKNNRMHGR